MSVYHRFAVCSDSRIAFDDLQRIFATRRSELSQRDDALFLDGKQLGIEFAIIPRDHEWFDDDRDLISRAIAKYRERHSLHLRLSRCECIIVLRLVYDSREDAVEAFWKTVTETYCGILLLDGTLIEGFRLRVPWEVFFRLCLLIVFSIRRKCR